MRAEDRDRAQGSGFRSGWHHRCALGRLTVRTQLYNFVLDDTIWNFHELRRVVNRHQETCKSFTTNRNCRSVDQRMEKKSGNWLERPIHQQSHLPSIPICQQGKGAHRTRLHRQQIHHFHRRTERQTAKSQTAAKGAQIHHGIRRCHDQQAIFSFLALDEQVLAARTFQACRQMCRARHAIHSLMPYFPIIDSQSIQKFQQEFPCANFITIYHDTCSRNSHVLRWRNTPEQPTAARYSRPDPRLSMGNASYPRNGFDIRPARMPLPGCHMLRHTIRQEACARNSRHGASTNTCHATGASCSNIEHGGISCQLDCILAT